MKKAKILFVHHGKGIGGAPISLLNLLKNLDQEKYAFKVIMFDEGKIINLYKESSIEPLVVKANTNWWGHHEKGKIQLKYWYKYPKILLDRKKQIKEATNFLKKYREYDIVHLNSDVLSSWALAAKKAGFKVVCHNRDPFAEGYFKIRQKFLRKFLNKYVDIFLSISEDNKHRLGMLDKTKVVYNFVDIPKQYRLSMKSSVDCKKVLYLGGMAKVKGFDTAVNCLPYLNPDVRVQFGGNLGKWKQPKSLKEKLKQCLKLSFYRKTYLPLKKIYEAKNVEVLGLLTQPLPVIDACDILITPFKIEHFSRPAMEAMAYGKPVIGSNVEGMDEIIDHGINGLLVEKNNPQALAEAINYLCENPEIAQRMGNEGRKKAIKFFSPEKNVQKIEEVYDRLLRQ